MPQQTMRQLTLACCILSSAVFIGALAVIAAGWTYVPVASLKLAATSIMVLTLVLQLAFVLAQLSPAGRAAVPFRFYGPDAWAFVLVASGMPGVLWHRLAGYAGEPMSLIMPGFVTPLITGMLFLLARTIQQRNYRDVVDRSFPPAV